MRKESIALILAGMMIFRGCTAAMADETESEAPAEIPSIDYTMMDDDYKENATWFTEFGIFDICVPSDWNIQKDYSLDDEVEGDVYFEAVNDDGNEGIQISYDPGDYSDIDEVAAALEAQGDCSSVQVICVNGIYCVNYTSTDDVNYWKCGLVTLGQGGGLFGVTAACDPAIFDDFTDIARNILLSFSLPEIVEESEA